MASSEPDAAAPVGAHARNADVETEAPASPSKKKPLHLALGLGVLLLLNYLFNELMDESGMHMVIVTGRIAEPARSAGATLFRSKAAKAANALVASGAAARVELLQHKGPDESSYAFVTVRRHSTTPEAAIATAVDAGLVAKGATAAAYRTVFPERARWQLARVVAEEGMHEQVGYLELLVQQVQFTVPDDAVDALKRGWPDLGYNALGEGGVVRCDLLQDASRPGVLLARKVFRGLRALEAHERSAHYLRWREQFGAVVRAEPPVMLNAVHPRSSPYPFQTAWATA